MKETLSDLIKGYEANYDVTLPKRMPLIVRIDGRAFHSFTKGFDRPYDELFIKAMQLTMLDLCFEIQGCQFGYVESDEISLLVFETNPDAEPYFGNRAQKIVSISASLATYSFNKHFYESVEDIEDPKKYQKYLKALNKGAMFDSRIFAIPESVINPYFVWRQNDATRNSILGLGYKYFSSKSLHGLKCNDIQNKLLTEADVNWNNESIVHKRGTCCYRVEDGVRNPWVLDTQMPILTEDRSFVVSKIRWPEEKE